ncbi:hypothetical protein SKAU_G00278490 [Synaphobranchus kaupii]|uniref:Reverse transcriptase domain-containing protein n=1 Tax=Synaphobranchus kaupii TaxID=118154 RepID=A0A9Q1INS7_SYNKA|nr:hypothetical protein SKAU_G00278490 [Synaphobranchus kaupii]
MIRNSFTHPVKESISACLADISVWMSSHHLKLNLDKTELLFMPYKTSPLLDLSITINGTTVTTSHSARNLGVVLDDQLDFKEHIRGRSCWFLLYNIRRIRPYLTTYSTPLLVQTMVTSCLDYCNSLLASLPACAILPLQLVQNAAARLVLNLPKFSHVTPPAEVTPLAASRGQDQVKSSDPGLHCSQKVWPLLPTGLNPALRSCSTGDLHFPPSVLTALARPDCGAFPT